MKRRSPAASLAKSTTRTVKFWARGGGAHITLGGTAPETSPLLRRPDLLRSFITYWQHHPSLSYIFAGQYIGPTSQSPRVDEARHDSLYELELAFLSLAPGKAIAPEVVDRLLSPFLQDVSGNTHRTALCIDKLYPAYNPPSRLGLLEFRGFEMPPDTGLRLLQMLLIRALVAWFWQHPFTKPLKRWGAELRDRWLLPHYLIQDFQAVLKDLKTAGMPFAIDWFTPFLRRRFWQIGKITLLDNPTCVLELRTALEPWPVIGDAGGSGTSRPVDNSMERLQLFLTGAVGDTPRRGHRGQALRPFVQWPSGAATVYRGRRGLRWRGPISRPLTPADRPSGTRSPGAVAV